MKHTSRLMRTVVVTLLLLSTSTTVVFAGPRADFNNQRVQARQDALKQQAVDRLHRLGDKLIDRRVEVLNRAISRVNGSNRVSESERAAIVADLNGNVADLTSLKAAIDAKTELETLRARVKSIFTDYRIFAVVLPRDRGELVVGRANAILRHLDALSEKIPRWINAAKARGKDVSSAEAAYKDFQARLADAKTQTAAAMGHFQAMKPAADTSEARNYLDQGKGAMRAARDDLRIAAADLRKIVVAFKGLRLGTAK